MGATIKKQLAEDKLVKVLGIGQLCHPKIVEIAGLHGGYDAVWLDQEHAGLSTAQLETAALAARSCGLDSFSRLHVTDYASAMQPLEAGVGGIMAAQIRNAAQVRDVVEWAKFHPLGMRGVNGTGADGRYGSLAMAEYFQKANDDTFIAIQIEHIEAVNDVEQIAAIPGVDVLFIGPADLSQSMGIPGQWEQDEFWHAVEKVANASQKNGIHWAILPLSPAFAKRCVDMGCKMLSIGVDTWIVQRGLREFLNDYAPASGVA